MYSYPNEINYRKKYKINRQKKCLYILKGGIDRIGQGEFISIKGGIDRITQGEFISI